MGSLLSWPNESKIDLPLSPDGVSYFQVTLPPSLTLSIFSVFCTFWSPARTDGKVLEFLVIWRFSFATTWNYSLVFDLTMWHFVLSAFLRPYNTSLLWFSNPINGGYKGPLQYPLMVFPPYHFTFYLSLSPVIFHKVLTSMLTNVSSHFP